MIKLVWWLFLSISPEKEKSETVSWAEKSPIYFLGIQIFGREVSNPIFKSLAMFCFFVILKTEPAVSKVLQGPQKLKFGYLEFFGPFSEIYSQTLSALNLALH